MSLTHTWEGALLTLATEAHGSSIAQSEGRHSTHDEKLLAEAYAYCEGLTAVHSRSFYISSSLLPAPKMRAARALYAFCRVTDDIVDHPDGDVEANIAEWRQRVFNNDIQTTDLVAIAWADARSRYHIPHRYAEQLIDGVLRDLVQTRYANFEELAEYSYGVASTVGLMSMFITGYQGSEALPYAIKLGVALQITNILRDVGEDLRRGRIYLPQDELEAYGICEEDLFRGELTPQWREFMRFQLDRNRQLYAEAWKGIGMLHPEGRFAIAAAAELYQAILENIERHEYDVFSRRAYIGRWGKMRRLPGVWWRSRNTYLQRYIA